MRTTDRDNKLIDMRIVTNTHLNKYGADKKLIIEQIKNELLLVIKAENNELLGRPVKTEEDVIKLAQLIGIKQKYTEEEGALYLGICLLAWDDIILNDKR